MTPEELKEIKEELAKITPGPWHRDGIYVVGMVPGGRPNGEVFAQCRPTVQTLWDRLPNAANAAFIAKAPERIAALVQAVEQLESQLAISDAELRAVYALHGYLPER